MGVGKLQVSVMVKQRSLLTLTTDNFSQDWLRLPPEHRAIIAKRVSGNRRRSPPAYTAVSRLLFSTLVFNHMLTNCSVTVHRDAQCFILNASFSSVGLFSWGTLSQQFIGLGVTFFFNPTVNVYGCIVFQVVTANLSVATEGGEMCLLATVVALLLN